MRTDGDDPADSFPFPTRRRRRCAPRLASLPSRAAPPCAPRCAAAGADARAGPAKDRGASRCSVRLRQPVSPSVVRLCPLAAACSPSPSNTPALPSLTTVLRQAKRRRLSKAVQSPPAKRPAKASKADRPQPEHTPAAAAPGSAGRKPARSAGRAASVRSVRTEATLFPALTAAAAVASALDDLQTPKDLIMKDGTAMADPFAFPASSEGFTASPAPPRLGGKKKKRCAHGRGLIARAGLAAVGVRRVRARPRFVSSETAPITPACAVDMRFCRTPPSTGGADAGTSEPRTSPRLPRKPKRLTLDKVGDAA